MLGRVIRISWAGARASAYGAVAFFDGDEVAVEGIAEYPAWRSGQRHARNMGRDVAGDGGGRGIRCLLGLSAVFEHQDRLGQGQRVADGHQPRLETVDLRIGQRQQAAQQDVLRP